MNTRRVRQINDLVCKRYGCQSIAVGSNNFVLRTHRHIQRHLVVFRISRGWIVVHPNVISCGDIGFKSIKSVIAYAKLEGWLE